MTKRLFHLVPDAHWLDLRGERYAPPSLATEGFVHLSLEVQLAGTLSIHFAGVRRVLLLELDPARLVDALRMEPSRGGEDFPHLYRALERSDVLGAWRLDADPVLGLALPDIGQAAPLALPAFWPS